MSHRNIKMTATFEPKCCAQHFGSHLLRELTFIVEANAFRWARLMKKLLREACHKVNKSTTKTLSEAERLAVRKRYRTILTQGGKELPEIPPRPKGKRGRIAKSDAHNLHERLVKHEESVLRFMGDPDVRFTNNFGYADNFFMPTNQAKPLIPGACVSDLSA